MTNDFYWRHARDSLLTPRAIQLFQILATKDGASLAETKDQIDTEYLIATGRTLGEDRRRGGKIQTAINVYREAGWVALADDEEHSDVIRISDAGHQALLLLQKLPDFLKAVPYFVTHVLGRYQINNPARPPSRNPEYDAQLANTDIFPYWTLWKIIRSCDDRLTADELQRFVLRLKHHEDIPKAIDQIRQYRREKEVATPEDELNSRYPRRLEGAIAEPKYIMGRLGTQIGRSPPMISKEGQSTYVLNPAYSGFIDEILKIEPAYKDYLTEEAWMSVHGTAVLLDDGSEVLLDGEEDKVEENLLSDEDPIWKQFQALLADDVDGVLLTGPPGTSKTWYASRLALKVASGHKRRVTHIQFHPSYSYEDFVEGYVPVQSAAGMAPSFNVQPKLFLRLCDAARRDPNNLYVLVIDEFSRGDPSRIFGEVLTYLERSYREKPFLLPYSGKPTTIPQNILIVGTMNPYDKSVADLDNAMERRFARIAMDPDVNMLRTFLKKNNAKGTFIEKAIRFFKSANEKSPHGFGHTFFLDVANEADLQRRWSHNLRFVFEKMFPFEPDVVKQLKDELNELCKSPENGQ